VIFSKDRPLQLDLCLNSLQINMVGKVDVDVIYNTSSSAFQNGYKKLEESYSNVNFIHEKDFQKDFENSIDKTDFVMFAVDDAVFCRKFDINKICSSIEKNLLGFSLRLGRNITYCYPFSCHQAQPIFENVSADILKFYWPNCTYDFRYPMEVSSSIYSTALVKTILDGQEYKCPNQLEDSFYKNPYKFAHLPYLGCYNYSVAFSNPINKVQTLNDNKSGGKESYSKESLLKLFETGYRIDPAVFSSFVPTSPHQEFYF